MNVGTQNMESYSHMPGVWLLPGQLRFSRCDVRSTPVGERAGVHAPTCPPGGICTVAHVEKIARVCMQVLCRSASGGGGGVLDAAVRHGRGVDLQ